MKKGWKAMLCLLLLLFCGGCGRGTQQAEGLADGKYWIDVSSSSSMFRVVSAALTVENGEMTADMTLGGKGYGYLFLGTAEEAEKASETEYLPFHEGEDGAYTYTIPVAALDTELDCAAWSIRKEAWYDRVLVFQKDTLRPWVADGTFMAEVTMEGGTGKAQITSPTQMTVKNGQMTARIEWSSPYYDYMIVDFVKYEPIQTEGNAVFEIPVHALDEEMTVIADTVAMSTPHEITYTVTFHRLEAEGKESE